MRDVEELKSPISLVPLPLPSPVLNKAAVFGDLVVEFAGGQVVGLSQPVHACAPQFVGAGVDALDQRARDAAAASGRRREQVFEVAKIISSFVSSSSAT